MTYNNLNAENNYQTNIVFALKLRRKSTNNANFTSNTPTDRQQQSATTTIIQLCNGSGDIPSLAKRLSVHSTVNIKHSIEDKQQQEGKKEHQEQQEKIQQQQQEKVQQEQEKVQQQQEKVEQQQEKIQQEKLKQQQEKVQQQQEKVQQQQEKGQQKQEKVQQQQEKVQQKQEKVQQQLEKVQQQQEKVQQQQEKVQQKQEKVQQQQEKVQQQQEKGQQKQEKVQQQQEKVQQQQEKVEQQQEKVQQQQEKVQQQQEKVQQQQEKVQQQQEKVQQKQEKVQQQQQQHHHRIRRRSKHKLKTLLCELLAITTTAAAAAAATNTSTTVVATPIALPNTAQIQTTTTLTAKTATRQFIAFVGGSEATADYTTTATLPTIAVTTTTTTTIDTTNATALTALRVHRALSSHIARRPALRSVGVVAVDTPSLTTATTAALNAIFASFETAKALIQMNVSNAAAAAAAQRISEEHAAASGWINDVGNSNTIYALDSSLVTATTTAPAATTTTIIPANNNTFNCTAATCHPPPSTIFEHLAALPWPNALAVAIFVVLFMVTVIGNLLVIVSVLTTRRLRTVTNCFVLNLAITDLLVGLFVMPPAVVLYIVGSWRFGWILCDIWISLDVLLCTASILSLCAISLDRYLAVTQPLTYSKKRRSKRLALFMILIVWVTALLITCPPYFGWYEQGQNNDSNFNCRYNQNKGYVVFSAMGSFFIPLAVMMYVYLKIGYVLKSRRQRIVRDANSERVAEHDMDCDNFISESEHYQCATPKLPSFKTRWNSMNGGGGKNAICATKQLSLHCDKCQHQRDDEDEQQDVEAEDAQFMNNLNKSANYNDGGGGGGNTAVTIGGDLKHNTSFYDLVEVAHLTSIIQCTAINCRYAGVCLQHDDKEIAIGAPLGGGGHRSSSLCMNAVHLIGGGGGGGGGGDGVGGIGGENVGLTYMAETCLVGGGGVGVGVGAIITSNAQNIKIKQFFGQQPPQQYQQQQQQQQHSTQHTNHHHHPHHQHHHPHQHCRSHHPHTHHHRIPMRVSTAKKGDTKAAKTLTTVMGGFIACWLPFFVYYLLKPFLPAACISEGLMSFFTWVGWVNCAINPFIYAFYNPDFRTAFRRIACKIICKKMPASNHVAAMLRG